MSFYLVVLHGGHTPSDHDQNSARRGFFDHLVGLGSAVGSKLGYIWGFAPLIFLHKVAGSGNGAHMENCHFSCCIELKRKRYPGWQLGALLPSVILVFSYSRVRHFSAPDIAVLVAAIWGLQQIEAIDVAGEYLRPQNLLEEILCCESLPVALAHALYRSACSQNVTAHCRVAYSHRAVDRTSS